MAQKAKKKERGETVGGRNGNIGWEDKERQMKGWVFIRNVFSTV